MQAKSLWEEAIMGRWCPEHSKPNREKQELGERAEILIHFAPIKTPEARLQAAHSCDLLLIE